MVLLELKPLWRKEAAPNLWWGRLREFSAVGAGKIFPGLEKQTNYGQNAVQRLFSQLWVSFPPLSQSFLKDKLADPQYRLTQALYVN